MFQNLLKKIIRYRAETAVMRMCHVSRGYVRAVIANMEDYLAGRITETQWQERAIQIAYRYPHDSQIATILRKAEGIE